MSKPIIGRGGGGKGGGGGSESPNTLKSQSYANIIDLLCEGPIEGFYHGAGEGEQDIYLDGVPLKRPDGTYNFSNYAYEMRSGTQDQDHLNDFPIAVPNIVNKITSYDTPATTTIYNTEVADAFKVIVSVDSLHESDKESGDLYGHYVNYSISLSINNIDFIPRVKDSIVGKTMSAYEKAVTIDIPSDWQGKPIYVLLERLSPDDIKSAETKGDINQSSLLRLKTVTTLTYDKLTYPNSALVALNINSEYFSSVPTRSYDLKLMQVLVPAPPFYNPETREYNISGGMHWDGSTVLAWSDNPAWCFYDLLTNSRYGLGKYLKPHMIDKWELFKIAKYCDDLVPDGFGGEEPRYTCNILINSRKEALNVVRDMAKIFRGMAYWSGSQLTFVYDHEDTPEMLFTNANVVDGVFSYSGSALAARKSVALVTWQDPEVGYEKVIEYVEDEAALRKYGYKEASLNAIGCTSRGQARRLGKWLLFSENYEGNLLGFSAGNIGASLRPGSVISISDRTKVASRLGGRIVSVSGNTVTIDQSLSYTVGSELLVEIHTPVVETLPNNTTEIPSVKERHIATIEKRTIIGVTGNVVTLSTSFGAGTEPLPGSMWIVNIPATVEPATFKVLSISENTDTGVYDVSAVKYSVGKYGYIEEDIPFTPRVTSNLTLTPTPVNADSMTITESLYRAGGAVHNKVEFDWADVPGALNYSVEYKLGNNNWAVLDRECSVSYTELLNAAPGKYTFKVSTKNSFNRRSPFVESAVYSVLGKTAPPRDVENFTFAPNKAGVLLTWDPVPDLDLHGYELRYGDSWDNGVLVDVLTATRALITLEDHSTSGEYQHSYHIRAIDTSGNYSENVKSLHVVFPPIPRVFGFSCVQALSRLELAWRPSNDPYLAGYEIREGVEWAQSSLIAVVNSTHYSIPYGGQGTRTFLIKAVSSLGIKSTIASFATTEIAQPTDMNAVFLQDEKEDDWPGIMVNAEVEAEKVVTEYGKLGGEYITEVDLGAPYNAQTTITFDKLVVAQDTGSWNTSTFAWDDVTADRSWLLDFTDSIGDIRIEIATEADAPTNEVHSWRFHSTLVSSDITTPISPSAYTPSKNGATVYPAYASPPQGRYSAGFIRQGVETLEYNNANIPDIFSTVFWVRPETWGTNISDASFEVLRLENTAGVYYLQLTYDYTRKKFMLTSNLSNPDNTLEVPYEVVPGELLAVGISQSSSTRKLFITNMQANNSVTSAKTIPKTTSGYNLLKVA